MSSLFQTNRTLSMSLCGGAVLLAAAAFASFGAPQEAAANAAAGGSPYFGRWTVDDPNAPFSVRGREYKTFDVAPCGRDFCGLSVGENGRCGPTMFRFLSKNRNAEVLKGHGRWGSAKKNVVIYTYAADGSAASTGLTLYLGDGYDMGGRSGNMPKYEAEYIKRGPARCTVRA